MKANLREIIHYIDESTLEKAKNETGKNSARNCQDGQHRFASMKLIICLERLFNRMRIANIRLTQSGL